MLSIIITAKDEAKTIKTAIEGFLRQINNQDEIILVAPDEATLNEAKKNKQVRVLKDQGKGKAAAMNLAISQAQGETLIFSDGDVIVDNNAVKELLAIDADVVTGKPVSQKLQITNYKLQNLFDYWQYVLFDTAHKLREKRDKKSDFLLLSGYLFLIKRDIIKNFRFNENSLTEDEYLSYYLWHRGHKIKYAPEAKVKVRFVGNYKDWLKQKVRTLGGSYQIPNEWKKKTQMRSFTQESLGGLSMWKSYVKNLKQAYWMKLLFLARLHVWLVAWWKIRILKQNRAKVWQRVESTK